MEKPSPDIIQIRKAKPSDASTIVQFQIAMAWESEKLKLDPAVVQKGVNAVFQDPHKGEYWVAHLDPAQSTQSTHQICGCLLTIPEWSDWRNGTVLWIHSVYVPPEHRQKKVFTALYQNLKEIVLKSPHLRGLRLYVEKSNQRAQKVYDNLGMSEDHYHLYEWLK